MRRLTASKLDLAVRCLFPWTSGLDWPDTGTSYSARLGKAFHEYAEHKGRVTIPELVVKHGLTPAQVRKLTAMAAAWRAWWSGRPTPPVRSREAKVQYEPAIGSADIIDSKGERDYSAAWRSALVGTADVVEADGGEVHVLDYKTGIFAPMPWESMQMKFLGLAFSRVYDAKVVNATIVTVSEKEGVREWSHTYSAEEIRETEDTLRRVHLQLAERPTPAPGGHCRFCPVREACPATKVDK